jgi:hypothetical protein
MDDPDHKDEGQDCRDPVAGLLQSVLLFNGGDKKGYGKEKAENDTPRRGQVVFLVEW